MSDIMKRVGRYQILQKIGMGSTGEVFKASVKGPMGIEKTVALKVLFPTHGIHSDQRKNDFINEARLGALLKHPNIVEVYDLGAHEERLFIAMEYIDGFSLRHLLDQKKRTSLATALRITKDIGQGLKYAGQVDYQGSELKLVHRDIKPANILLNRQGISKIADFGLARALGISEITEGGIQGTLNYMSPEQAKGERLDFRSDIFSLGLILFEMLCGERVFDNRHHYSVILKIQQIEALWERRLRGLIQEHAPAVEAIVRQMLFFLPKKRYSSYDLLILDIEELLLRHGAYHVGLEESPPELLSEEPSQSQELDDSSVSVILHEEEPFLVGREPLLSSLSEKVERHSLVQIKGGVGIGKTALARAFITEQKGNYDRRLFIPLEGVRSKQDFTSLLFRDLALTAPDSDGVQELLDFFRVVQSVLLVLDADEPPSTEILSVLKFWSASHPELRILICSRLLIEPNIPHVDLPPLSNTDVIQFFQERNPTRSSSQIQQLIPYVEGIPLFMVLTSVQLQNKDIVFSKYIQRLRGKGTEPSWQNRMDISWELLKPWEQNALCQLSVFEGYFSMHAAEKVIDLKEYNMEQMCIDVLGTLVSHSLLNSENRHGEIIFLLSRRLNNYVRSHFQKDEYHLACHRHAEFYAFSSQVYLNKRQLLQFYHFQEQNFGRAIRKSVQYGWTDLAIRCVLTWQSCVGKLNIPYVLFPLLQEIINNPDVSPIGRAELQYISGQQLRLRGKYFASVQILLAAKKTFAQYNRDDRIADVECSLCVTYTELARYIECNEAISSALSYARKIADIKREAIYLKDYGYSLSQQGRLDEALKILETAARYLWKLGEPVHAFSVCSNLGLVQLRRNQIDRAAFYFRRAIQISKKGFINEKIDMIWMNLGICAVLQGDIPKAELAFVKASKQMKKVGALRSLAILYANWGKLRMLKNDFDSAHRFVAQGAKLCMHHPHPITEHTLAMVRVSLYLLAREPQNARGHWYTALEIVESNQYTFKRVETLCLGVELFSQMGLFDKAQDYFFKAKDTSSKNRVDSFWLCYAQAQFSKYKQNSSMFASSFKRAQELVDEYFPKRADIRYYFQQLRYSLD